MRRDFPEEWTGELVKKMHMNKVRCSELAKELGVTEAYISMLLNSKRHAKGAKERLERAFESIVSSRG